MERRILELEERIAADPAGIDAAVDLALELRRLGDVPGAFALVDAVYDHGGDPRARELRDDLVAGFRLADSLRPRAIWRGEHAVRTLAMDASETRVAVAQLHFVQAPAAGYVTVVRLLELDQDRRVVGERVVEERDQAACALAFSPDGALLATGGAGMRAWDVASGARRAVVAMNHLSPDRVAFRRGELIGSGSAPGDAWGERIGSALAQVVGTRRRESWKTPIRGLVLADQPPASRGAVFDRLVDHLVDAGIDYPVETWRLIGEGGVRPPRTTSLRRLVLGVLEDPLGTALALGIGPRVEVVDLGMRRLWTTDHPDAHVWLTSGGWPPVSGALAVGGRCLAVGSRGAGRWGDPYHELRAGGMTLFSHEHPDDPVELLGTRWVTAVAFSPSGTTLLAGTNDGEVLLVDLTGAGRRSTWVAPRPRARVPVLEDPAREDGGVFRFLRSILPHPVRFPRALLAADEGGLWVLSGNPRAEREVLVPRRGGVPERTPLTTLARRIPFDPEEDSELLGTDPEGRVVRAVRTAGVAEDVYRLEPLGAAPRIPALPDPPLQGKRIPDRREIEAALGVQVRSFYPSPDGRLAALRAVRRDREVWVVLREDPRRFGHLVAERPVRSLCWSPDGSRLAVLLRTGGLEIHGFGDPVHRVERPESLGALWYGAGELEEEAAAIAAEQEAGESPPPGDSPPPDPTPPPPAGDGPAEGLVVRVLRWIAGLRRS